MTVLAASRSPKRRLVRRILLVVAAILAIPYVLVPLYAVGTPVSTLMMWRWVTGQPVTRIWVPLADMAPALPRSVLAAEDARFCGHTGIDWTEIQDALEDAEDGGRLRGGSTITQQTVKNLFLWHGRSWVRKALEMPLAVWADLILPKRRIMELYLNVAEWGPNGVFGAEAGARRAFGRGAAGLSERQAAILAAVLPNPVRRDAAKPGPGVRRLAGIYQRRARTSGPIDACLR